MAALVGVAAGLGLAGTLTSFEGLDPTALFAALVVCALAATSAVTVRRRLVRPLQALAEIARQSVSGTETSPDASTGSELAPLGPAVLALVDEVDRSRASILAGAVLEGSSDLTIVLGATG